MAKQADFDKFLSNIEPSATTVSYISSIQTDLRKYLRIMKNIKIYMQIHFFPAHMQSIHLFARSLEIKT